MNNLFEKFLGASWHTTLLGVGSILGAIADIIICLANDTQPHWEIDMTAIWTGLIGVFAKDKGVSNAATPVEARQVRSDLQEASQRTKNP